MYDNRAQCSEALGDMGRNYGVDTLNLYLILAIKLEYLSSHAFSNYIPNS